MPAATLGARATLVLLAVLATLAAWPSAASAGLEVTGATLENGATGLTSPPGGVLDARVTTRLTSGTNWQGTQYRFGTGARACVNTDNKTSDGSHSNTFNVTSPGAPGDYDAGFTAWSSDDCRSGTASTEKVQTDMLRVTSPGPNDDLPPRCGINVMLVLDESGSIASSNATEAVRSATRAFLDALSGTGASVAVTDFSTTAQLQVDYTTVTPESVADVFNPYIDTRYDPNGWTNWQAAFDTVHASNAKPGGKKADLVVFITDGDPTARNTATGGQQTGLTEGAVEALEPAWREADLVKEQGSHVFALGVGAAVTKPTSARRLTAVSGFDQFPQEDFEKADYTLVEDFDDLAQALRDIAIALCRASVTVTKQVDEGDGVFRPAKGWDFTADVTVPGGYAWTQPDPPPSTGPRTQTTNDDGVATFQWQPQNSSATSTVTLTEVVKPGYVFVDYTCTKNAPGRTQTRTRRGAASDNIAVGTLGPNEYAKCTVRNRRAPPEHATIRIIKDAVPDSSKVFSFTGEPLIGAFDLTDDDEPDPPTFRDFSVPAGTYVVRETPQDTSRRLAPRATWEFVGITCSKPGFPVVRSQVSITVGPGEGVSCTFQNVRGDEPTPEPPIPPDPPTPTPPLPPEPVPPDTGGEGAETDTATRLGVVKRATRIARVGQRIRFTLRVTNVGPVAARGVRLADVPPAALALASFRPSVRARVVRGNPVWQLGTLEPGASRVIRGSVRITGGTAGRKRNRVLATAINAQLVGDRADTRLLAQRRAPDVTG